MIHHLPITTAHDTPVNKNHPSTPQVVTCKDPIPYNSPHKEGNTPWSLNLLNTFPRKDNGQGASQLIAKRTDIKSPIFCQLPSHTIAIHSGRKIWTQSAEKFIHTTHFLIIWSPNKKNIPASPILYPQPLKRRGHQCLFIGCNPIHTRKGQLKWRVPTPLICLEFNSISHPYHKANIFSKFLPPHADTSPQATHMSPST